MKVYCLFEQSGTFKNIYNNKGDTAIDIDIENQFGETDIIIDLFHEIENIGDSKLFNGITSNDLVFAFFPCTWFSNNNDLIFRRQSSIFKKMTETEIDNYINNRYKERERALNIFISLIHWAENNNIKLIIENPRSHFLKDNYRAGDILHCRNVYGDKYKKPTYYYTINCRINENKMIKYNIPHTKDINHLSSGIQRSLISPLYAENLINVIERSEIK